MARALPVDMASAKVLEMKSQNFEFLRPRRPVLADLAAFAEEYAHSDPASSLIKQRGFIEQAVHDARVAVEVLEIETAGQVEMIPVAGVEIAVKRPQAIAKHAADQGEECDHAVQAREGDGHGALHDLEERDADAGERG